MRKIISSIDIGSGFIKLLVGEFIGNRLNILGASKVDSHGLVNNEITDREALIKSIKHVVDNVSNALGADIKKTILGINTINSKLVKTTYTINIEREDNTITGEDISTLISKCAEGKIEEGYVLLGAVPVEFLLDNNEVVKDPKGIKSSTLSVKAIVVTSPKDYVKNILEVVEESGLKVVDVIPNCIGDYYSFRTNTSDSRIGAVINLGYETTSISIFNKRILTNTKVIKIGSKNIEKDISFIHKIDEKNSRAIYKDIVLASPSLANPNEYRIVTNEDGKNVKIDQYELSEIAASRIEEILNLAKKQINILTKKEISYIIVTGGLTEIRDFRLTLESVFGKNVYLGTLNIIGARDNSYSSAIGILKYFDEKITLRGKTFSIFTSSELNNMNNGEMQASSNANNNSLLSKVFGYFFDS